VETTLLLSIRRKARSPLRSKSYSLAVDGLSVADAAATVLILISQTEEQLRGICAALAFKLASVM